MNTSINESETVFVPTSIQSIALIPSLVKDILFDVFYKNINSNENALNNMRGNVQHRLNGSISEKERDEIILEATNIISKL